jgi:hypothetical protein
MHKCLSLTPTIRMQIGDPFTGLGRAQEKGGHLKIYSPTASMQNASSASHRKCRHRKRPEARRNPPSSSSTADPPPPSRRPPLLPAAGRRIKPAASLPVSPPSRIQRPVASEEPRSPTTVPLSPPTSHLTGMLSRGKRRRTGRRASPPCGGSIRAPSAPPASPPSAAPPANQEHVAGPPPEECLARRGCCSFTSRVAGDANYLLCLRRLLDGDFRLSPAASSSLPPSAK